MTRRNRLLIAFLLLIPLLAYTFISVYSRLMADDYCYAVSFRQYGLLGSISYYYENWFGRISQTVGATLGSALGVGFAQIFPILLLLIWFVGLWWLCRELAEMLHWNDHLTIFIGAELILYATLAGTAQIYHSLYWISGFFPYTVPLVLATYLLAIVVRTIRRGGVSLLELAVSLILTGIAELSSEPFALAFIGALAGGIVGVLLFRPRSEVRRAALTLLIPNLLVAGIALVIMVAAPGNAVRQGLFPTTHAPVALVTQSLIYAGAIIISLILIAPLSLPLALFLPALIAYSQPRTQIARRTLRRWIAFAFLVAFGLIFLLTVPAIYATSTAPPARVLIIPQFVLVGACVVMGYLAGLHARSSARRPPRLIAAVVIGALLIGGPLLTAVSLMSLTPKLSTYAQEWDQRDAQIRAAAERGQQSITVAPLSFDVASMTGLDTLATEGCAAPYYGLASLTVSQ
ncbi:MAG: hypothetical protein GC204_20730 [Chloroflexi bacterium]|nr:hypothetical protein [Chloroflexota bacterium]